MRFWFCRYIGQSLPLIALRYNDILFNFRFKDLSQLCYVEDDPTVPSIGFLQNKFNINIKNANMYIEHVFLDSEERARFAQSSHEYLIEMVQYNTFSNINCDDFSAHLTFTHPTKYVIWFFQPASYRKKYIRL